MRSYVFLKILAAIQLTVKSEHSRISHSNLDSLLDLLGESPRSIFTPSVRCLRCPIRDEEQVDIGAYFRKAYTFIEQAKTRGAAVLVHCHEGKSRSITLVLAYLMKTQVSISR